MMMNSIKLRRYLCVALLITFSFQASAQNGAMPNDIQGKYWYYRYKLRNDFMVMGLGGGKSIPASVRNRHEDGLNWGEGTMYMGWYLGVLATENWLLNHDFNRIEDGHDPDGFQKNLTELYYAMKALERMDLVADVKSGGPPSLNGFLTRDDVPHNFVPDHFDELHSSYTHDVNRPIGYFYGGDRTDSDWKENNTNYLVGRDQLAHVLMGLRLVSSFTPNTAVAVKLADGSPIPDNGGYYNFTGNANLMAIRIIDRALAGNKLRMINPNTGNQIPEDRGGSKTDLYWPYEQIKKEYQNGIGQGVSNMPLLNTPLGYIDPLTKPKFSIWWQVFKGATTNPNNPSLTVTITPNWLLSTILSGGQTIATFGNANKADNRHQACILGSIGREVAPEDKIMQAADWEGWKPFYQLLYNTIRVRSKSGHIDAFNHLNSAPCQGISLGMGLPEVSNWKATHRYIKSKDDQQYGQNDGDNGKLTGYFSGLDYMLMHNLFYMSSDAFNLMREYRYGLNRDINEEINNVSYNTVYNKIRSSASLLPSAQVLMRGGVSVTLEPGFNTDPGAEFEAVVDPFECGPGVYNRERYLDDEDDLESTPDEVKVFPNPAQNFVNVDLPHCEECSYNLVLTDAKGQTVSELQNVQAGSQSLALDGLSKGIYLLRIVNQSTQMISNHKVVKQ